VALHKINSAVIKSKLTAQRLIGISSLANLALNFLFRQLFRALSHFESHPAAATWATTATCVLSKLRCDVAEQNLIIIITAASPDTHTTAALFPSNEQKCSNADIIFRLGYRAPD